MAGELLVNWKFADAGRAPATLTFAVMAYVPGVPPATKLAVKVPAVIEHVDVTIGAPVKVQEVAVGSKPEPDTCTVVPT